MIPAEASTAISLLEKPLSELTEDDIGQITREECRRFLKDRGMRRPSWNKSQAIQQVISLKALLEDNTDSDNLTAGIRIRQKPRNPLSPPLLTSPHSSLPSPTEASGSGDSRCARTPAKDPSPYRRKYPISSGFTVCDSPRVLTAGVRPQIPTEFLRPPPRTVADDTTEQLTIFYGGKVNVYEGVPFDKAREILHLAATQDPIESSSLTPVPSTLSFLHRFPPYFAGPLDRRPVADLGYHLNLPAGKLQRSFKDNLAEGKALREPLPGKRAEIGNGGSGRVQQVEKHH